MKSQPTDDPGNSRQLPKALAKNIQMLIEQHREDLKEHSRARAMIHRVAAFISRAEFVYLHLVLFGAWIAINTGVTGLPRFDPHLDKLAVFAALESLFVSGCILINQRRNEQIAEERAELHLNISLLSERESTRVVRLVAALAQRAGIETSADDLDELMEDIRPEEVLQEIKREREGGA